MIAIKNKLLKGYAFIDLFAGFGGFRLALESLGATCVYANEWNQPVQAVYAKNFRDFPDDDITKVNASSIPDQDILCAGFPCQAFSISGKQQGFADSRGTLFFDIARIVKEKHPKILFLENVKKFEKHDSGNTFTTIKNIIESLGYRFFAQVLNAADYGIPQKRERIYMVCFRKDLKISSFSFPNPITELCKKTENCYRTVARILKLYETMETDAIYQCLNQSRYSTVICGQKCNVRIFCFDECSFCIRQIVRIVDRLRIEPSEWWLQFPFLKRIQSRISLRLKGLL